MWRSLTSKRSARTVKVGLVLAALVFTSLQATLVDNALTVEVQGMVGTPPHHFAHPIVLVLIMLLGESLALLLHFVLPHKFSRKPSHRFPPVTSRDSLPSVRVRSGVVRSSTLRRKVVMMALCDVAYTTLDCMALVYGSAVVFLGLRGVGVMFTALFSTTVLQSKYSCVQLLGVLVVVVGVVILSVSIGTTDSTPRGESAAIAFGIFAQVFQAVWQVTAQTVVVRYRTGVQWLLGWSGSLASSIMLLVTIILFFPKYNGSPLPDRRVEHPYDALIQMSHDWRLALTVCSILPISLIVNLITLELTRRMGATLTVMYESWHSVILWTIAVVQTLVSHHQRAATTQYMARGLGALLLIMGTLLFDSGSVGPLVNGNALGDPLTGASTKRTTHNELNQSLTDDHPGGGSLSPSRSRSRSFHTVNLNSSVD